MISEYADTLTAWFIALLFFAWGEGHWVTIVLGVFFFILGVWCRILEARRVAALRRSGALRLPPCRRP